MRVVSHHNVQSLPRDLRDRVESFLERYIPESTVTLPASAFRSATMWSLALDDDGTIIGFAAQRLLRDPDVTIVQVMSTFLAPRLRGSLMATTLLQGSIFVRAWMHAPFRPIIWCTRTRVPGVYRSAARFNQIYPDLASPAKNRAVSAFAERVARRVYGDHVTLRPDTFVLEESIAPGCGLLPLRHTRTTPVYEAFARLLNYEANEAIFIMCRLNQTNIVRYLAAATAFRVANWRRLARASVQRKLARLAT
jgi:hypothetical protein